MIWQIESTSSEQTEQLGRNIGARLRGGEVIELRSDLGGGKTTFTRGLAAGVGSKDAAASPSFTISRVYDAGKLVVHHYDFYRLPEAGLMGEEISEVLEDTNAVIVVEWAEVVQAILPPERIVIQIEATGETDRRLTITVPQKMAYIREGN